MKFSWKKVVATTSLPTCKASPWISWAEKDVYSWTEKVLLQVFPTLWLMGVSLLSVLGQCLFRIIYVQGVPKSFRQRPQSGAKLEFWNFCQKNRHIEVWSALLECKQTFTIFLPFGSLKSQIVIFTCFSFLF